MYDPISYAEETCKIYIFSKLCVLFCSIIAKDKHMLYNMNKGGIIYGTKYTEFFRNK